MYILTDKFKKKKKKTEWAAAKKEKVCEEDP
jgi:hypothetical protein